MVTRPKHIDMVIRPKQSASKSAIMFLLIKIVYTRCFMNIILRVSVQCNKFITT